jgi:hypothetical protein
MNDQDRASFEPRIADWLEGDPNEAPDQALQVVLAAFPSIRQRHGPRLPWRFRTMPTSFKVALGAMAVVAVVLGGAYILRPGTPDNEVGGPPTASASAGSTASPAHAQPSAATASSSPAPFTSSNFKVPIGFTLSDGWSIVTDEPGTVGMLLGDAGTAIVSLDSVTVRGATSTAPWVPLPDDIHAWLAGRPEFRPDAARTGVVGGRPAVIVDADYVREKITDQGDWIRYGTGSSDGINMKGSWPGRVHIVVVKTGPKTGIVVVMDAPLDVFDGATVSVDKMLATLTFR